MASWLDIQAKSGFTLTEMLMTIMIIGVLTTIAVPQYFKIVEKNKAGEALNLFPALKGAQDRYKAKYGVFCNDLAANCSGFDFAPPPLRYFNPVGKFDAGGSGDNQSWSLTLTRADTPAVYGAYQFTYDSGAMPPMPPLTCNQSDCQLDFLPPTP